MYDEGTPGVAVALGRKFGHFGNSYPSHLENSSFLGLPRHVRQFLAVLDNGQLWCAMELIYSICHVHLQFNLVVRCQNLTTLVPTMMWAPGR